MTEERLPLNELLRKAGDGDFLRAVAESVRQLLMEADVEGLIGAGRHERAADRLNWRNGYRDRTLENETKESENPRMSQCLVPMRNFDHFRALAVPCTRMPGCSPSEIPLGELLCSLRLRCGVFYRACA
jgi:hypothetical protein